MRGDERGRSPSRCGSDIEHRTSNIDTGNAVETTGRDPPRQVLKVLWAWIPERSATGLREADLNVLSKLGNQGLEWRLEPEAFTGGEVGREDDLLDVLVGCPVDIQVARQPST
jgi:hypothetical protein